MDTPQRQWVCAYGNGRIGEITLVTSLGDCRVRVYLAGATEKDERQWTVSSFASAIAKSNELARESSHPLDWVETNRD